MLIHLRINAQKIDLRRNDSLWQVVKNDKSVVNKASAYVMLSEELGDHYVDTIPYFCSKAIQLLEGKYSYYNENKESIYNTLALAYNNMGVYTAIKFDQVKSISYFEKSIGYYRNVNNSSSLVEALNNLGATYARTGKLEKALSLYDESMKISQKTNDLKRLVDTYEYIGDLNYKLKDSEKALDYRRKGLEIAEKLNNPKKLALAYGNMGLVLSQTSNYQEALFYYRKAQSIAEAENIGFFLTKIYNNIGDIHNKLNNTDSSFYYLNKSIELKEKYKSPPGELAPLFNNMSRLYMKQKRFEEAANYGEKSYEMALKSGNIIDKYQAKEVLSYAYRALDKHKEAFDAYLVYVKLRDSVFSESNKRALIKREYELEIQKKELESKIEKERLQIRSDEELKRLEMKASFEKESQKLELLQKNREMMMTEAIKREKIEAEYLQKQQRAELIKQQTDLKVKEEKKRQLIIIVSISVLFIILSAFSYMLFRRFQVTKQQKELINTQKEEVLFQKHIVEEKNKEIFDSITYAKRIQNAILPSMNYFKSTFPDSFILYSPKDIVAGDFYWMEKTETDEGEYVFIAAADSTGHGVPGALVSVVCSNALNRAVNEFKLVNPGSILNKTRDLVLETFSKSQSHVMDGMDISLCVFDKKRGHISWSGANNSLWYIRDNEFMEIKAHKQPIGKTSDPTPFPTHELQLNKGDELFLITDGYADQFGGIASDSVNEKEQGGKKFKQKRLKELLFSLHNRPCDTQLDLLEKAFNDWKGNLEQVDDVTIIGIKI